jgi:hypothetical protein
MRINLYTSVVVFALSSCISIPTSITKEAKSTDVNGMGVTHVPVTSDLIISDKKVTASHSGEATYASWDYLKEMAVAKALESADSDVLLEPNYELKLVGKERTVTVVGYPAKYRNFRNMQFIERSQTSSNEPPSPSNPINNNNKKK